MKLEVTQLARYNWFYIGLLAFVAVLPLSQALVTIVGGLLLFIALFEDSIQTKIQRLKQNKVLLLITGIFFIYLLSTLLTLNGVQPFFDLQRALLYFVFPVAFVFGKEINALQKKSVLHVFTVSVFVGTVVTVVNWKLFPEKGNFSVHTASLVAHIRFSFQLILVFWFLILDVVQNRLSYTKGRKIGLLVLAVYFFLFIFFQQSITGIIALYASIVFVCFHYAIKSNKQVRIRWASLSLIILFLPLVYLGIVVNKFYNIETVTPNSVEKFTKSGNPYTHFFDRKEVENGKYVYLYICEEEMRQEWNRVAKTKFDSLGSNGYSIFDTIVRYLTSKGLSKDREGILALTAEDVQNIERGIANVIYTRKLSIYPRLYQTVWEYYNYTNTGYVNHQSFAQRIEFAKAALTIIKKNKWIGVGTGHWRTEFANAFKENNSQLDEKLYSSSHNQYLNYMVKFGIIGFLIILALLIIPALYTKRYHDLLFVILLVFIFIANFGDSNLETHMGSSFFLFFYCLFISTDGIDYLKQRN